ncbi:hypothetical protein HPB48_018563 [Haemaphysalis longicornis]|uniref:Endonuclease/exonuclease/phosphatase domain-containing protein n=1 Tax=Haemaphysalis longicornis TaxID=44386 RepID=A0A9J6FMP7_HAELO|nr:hypothetical protein HPB48_018563 [Haemaphysalis longicornis]
MMTPVMHQINQEPGKTTNQDNHGQDPPSLTVWQWNCRGLQPKRAVQQQHIEHAKKKPDVILLQETLTATPTLPGYRVQEGPAGGRGLCTLVRKGLTFLEHEIKNKIEHVYTEIMSTKNKKRAYSS